MEVATSNSVWVPTGRAAALELTRFSTERPRLRPREFLRAAERHGDHRI